MDSNTNEKIPSPSADSLNRRSLPPTLGDEYLFLRICVPDLNIQKCFQFRKNHKISDIKEQCVTSLPLELKQSFNYGLFCPPTGTKCGKFLDEEKLLNEYPFSDYVGYLELRFKQRIYKSSKIDEKQFKAINTRANLRRLLEYVHNGQVEKVTKLCSKGLDPNFHCVETGETPLTLASTLPKSAKLLMALVHGGAFLDFRNLAGSAPLHRAVESNNLEALITLLELGSSPNYKDSRGLTALYLSITRKTDVLICERLLRDKATIGAQDMQGWQEIHQACRYGLVQHLEHLLFYGAEVNVKNASGNTPLHVCAVNGQEACARVLLQKGVQTDALNFANQTPYQVAVIAGNLDLASIIQSYKAADIVEKTVNDCSDVISNNSSGIGTANSSDFTESSFATKSNNDSSNSSNSGTTLEDNFSPLMCKSRASIACFENGANASLLLPTYRPSKNLKDRTTITNKYYATAPRQKHQLPAEPRTVVLHKSKRGFGFVLRGAKATASLLELKTSGMCPALQYLDDVDKGSVADLAGLRKGDYLLAINGEDVSMASHSEVVDLIRNSGKLVTMTVVSRPANVASSFSYSKYNEWQTTAAPVGYATLPTKLKKNRNSLTGQVAPLPPRRDPKTTLSIGETKAKHFHAKLRSWDNESNRQNCDNNQPKTASIRSRPISSRITTAELEELFQRQAELSPVYHDKADTGSKCKKYKLPEKTELRRNFYSVPDLVQITINSRADDTASLRNHKSQDNVNGGAENSLGDESSSTSSQLSNVSNAKTKSKSNVYGHCMNGVTKTVMGINSSFNPNNQAIIYAAPSDLNNQYSTLQPRQVRKSASIHSHSSLNRVISRIPFTNQSAGQCQTVRYRMTCAGNSYAAAFCLSPPPIPDPDYSQSDEDSSEQAKRAFKMSTLPLPGSRKCGATKITLRGGGDGSDVGAKHFNVEEIRKVRLQLRNSASFPVNYTVIANTGNEDGDNSSSGVSSDQEIPQQQSVANNMVAVENGTVVGVEKNSVSFASVQLPALNSDAHNGTNSASKEGNLVVLPPPDFVGNVSPAAVEVLEPPPQFSDNGSF